MTSTLNLTQLSEEQDRLELVYKTTAPKVNLAIEVNSFKMTGEADEISLRKIIREEVAAALSKENDGSLETENETKRTVGFVGKRYFPPKPRRGKPEKIMGVSTASCLNIFGKTVHLKIFVNAACKWAIQHHLAMLQAHALRRL